MSVSQVLSGMIYFEFILFSVFRLPVYLSLRYPAASVAAHPSLSGAFVPKGVCCWISAVEAWGDLVWSAAFGYALEAFFQSDLCQ